MSESAVRSDEEQTLEATEQIRLFQEFLDLNYKGELLEAVRKDEPFLIVEFGALASFHPELADLLLEQPEEVLKAAEIAAEQFDLPKKKKLTLRVKNLPESQLLLIRNIRSKDLGKFYAFDGVVRQKSDVRPQVTQAKFECPSCGNIISVLQLDNKFKEPSRCGCGRKGKFRLIHKELVDAQGLVLEESTENLEGGAQPKRMNVFLKNDLVSPISERRTNPGQHIKLTGIVKEIPITTRQGVQSTKFDLLIEANFVESVDEDYSDIKISDKEIEEIKELAKDPKLSNRLVKSIAPSIYGHEKIKEALILQMLGGVKKVRNDGSVTRGDFHVLLIGDPGAGKSQMLKRMSIVAPKSRYVSGKGASGAGLTASVVKDEFLSGWSLEAGALVLANKGMCMIDELDKMTVEDRSAMHEALEQQSVTISKANIQATLRSETTVLAAANPKFGRFDPYETLARQIDLPSTLINRFDLIFPIRDLPNEETDKRMADFLLNLHRDPDGNVPEIDTVLLRKFIIYAKQNIKPVLSESAIEELRDYYIKMRSSGSDDSGAMKSIPISARQLEGLVRLSEACAKMRLSQKVSRKDAKKGIELLHFCLSQVGLDPETGQIDIDRISTGVTTTERSKIVVVREIIRNLESSVGKTIPMDDIVSEAMSKGLDESVVDEAIEKLKRSGDIFEPKSGFIQRID